MRTAHVWIAAALGAGLGAAGVHAQQTAPDLGAEIARLRRELAQVQSERQRTERDTERDKKEHAEYLARTAARKAGLQSEIDSLRRETQTAERRNDSLGALILQTQTERRQVELAQDGMRQALVAVVRRVSGAVLAMPPMVRSQAAPGLSLLESELTGRTVDNMEGLNRLWQILNTVEEAAGAIQIAQENSSFADIRGVVYRLRIGALFEAVVDEKGTKGMLWSGAPASESEQWVTMVEPELAAEVHRAVAIREGRRLPAFVTLPLAGTASEAP